MPLAKTGTALFRVGLNNKVNPVCVFQSELPMRITEETMRDQLCVWVLVWNLGEQETRLQICGGAVLAARWILRKEVRFDSSVVSNVMVCHGINSTWFNVLAIFYGFCCHGNVYSAYVPSLNIYLSKSTYNQ